MKKHKIGFANQFIIIVCALLLLFNVALGAVMMNQSGGAMKTLIRRYMISVAETAAATVDGDVIEKFTESDVGSDEFNRISDMLLKIAAAQEDNEVQYIYAAKKSDFGYVFTVDPDPISPAAFGESVVYSSSQDAAWEGVSAVDNVIYTDKWGSYYTAWSPIRNSAGQVVGLVGVDFNVEWYNRMLAQHTASIIAISGLSLLVGAVVMVLLTGQLRRRIRALDSELLTLSDDLEALSDEIGVHSEGDTDESDDLENIPETDTIGALSTKIRMMQGKLKKYKKHAHEQAYTDSMTGVENKTAYLEYVQDLNRRINSGTASFAVAVFDINGLKQTNDNYGHECGDTIITDTAVVIRRVYSRGRIFRIGGDEFIAVLEGMPQSELDGTFEELAQTIADFNSNEKQYVMTLSFSYGGTVYAPGRDSDFKEVFKRADEDMYKNKGNYYRQFGDRRRKSDDSAQ